MEKIVRDLSTKKEIGFLTVLEALSADIYALFCTNKTQNLKEFR